MKPPNRGGPGKGTPRGPGPQGRTPSRPAPGRSSTSWGRTAGPPPDRGSSRAGSKPPAPAKPAAPREERPVQAPSAHTLTAPHRTAPPREAPEPQTQARRHGPEAPRGAVWLYGIHPVAAALANPARRLRRLLLTEDAERGIGARLGKDGLGATWPIAPERSDRARLDQLLGHDMAHQGAALLADPLAPPSLAQALERPGPVLVLDQITDPRNIGAILRSAAAFGVAAVITQERNSPEETGALAKAASGALEKVPLFRAVNIARTLVALKAAGAWVIGLDAGGAPLSGPALRQRRVVLVLGSEGEGLRRLTRETCDEVAGLAVPAGHASAMESLNVAAAAAIALYEVSRPE